MIHLCAQHNRIKTPGKQKRHVRRCPICRDAYAMERARRMQLRSSIPVGAEHVIPGFHPLPPSEE